MKVKALALILLGFISTHAKAEPAPLVGYKCTFTHSSDINGRNSEGMLLTYIAFDDESVYLHTEHGTGAVKPNYANRVQSFSEHLDTGSIAITTINLKTGAAVHSRNMVILGDMMASQFYGKCDIANLQTKAVQKAK